MFPSILWCDEDLVAVNKPAGLPTLPDGYDRSAPHVKGLLEPTLGRLWIVHRLDRECSGILLLARSARVHRFLNDQFASHQVIKEYLALVKGNPNWEEERVNLPLRADVGHCHRSVVDHDKGKPAVTHFHLVKRLEDFTWLKAVPETGRTHQIRVHLAALGLPIAGDKLYGGALLPGQLPLARLALHAYSLAFKASPTDKRICLLAPFPPDLQKLFDIEE